MVAFLLLFFLHKPVSNVLRVFMLFMCILAEDKSGEEHGVITKTRPQLHYKKPPEQLIAEYNRHLDTEVKIRLHKII